MKNTALLFFLCVICFSNKEVFSQSFVKRYTDNPKNYLGLNVLPIENDQTAIIGYYYNNTVFSAIIDSLGQKEYTDYIASWGYTEASNLTKISTGFTLFYFDGYWNMSGNQNFLDFINDTLNLISHDEFFGGYDTWTGNINLNYLQNKGIFFTATGWGLNMISRLRYTTTFISKYDSIGNVVWNESFGPSDSAYQCQVFNSITTSDSGLVVMGRIYDTLQLKKYDYNGNQLFDYKYSILAYYPSGYTSPYDYHFGYFLYGKLIQTNRSILSFGNAYDTNTHKFQLALEIINLGGSFITQKKFILNKDTANITLIAVYAQSDTTAILNYSVAGSILNYYLIVNYQGDSLDSFTLPAYTVSTFDNGNILCALDTNNSILVREYSPQETLVYQYLYKPSDTLNVCNDIKPLTYPGRFVLTGSSDSDLLIIRQDTSAYSLGINNLTQPNAIKVYPNPTKGTITFEFNKEINGFIDLYDVKGSLVLHKQITNSIESIDCSGLTDSVYLYKVMDEKGNIEGEGKVVIQR